MEVYRGDIFYVENSYGTEGSEQRPGRPALVVSNDTGNKFSSIVSVVWLTTQEKKPLPTHCEVVSGVPSTAICEQIVTISKTRLGGYIRTATEEEMQCVDKCLMIALGLDLPVVTDVTAVERISQQEIDDLKMKLEGAERKLEEAIDGAVNEKNILNNVIDKLKKENDELRQRPIFAPDPEEIVVLKTQVEMLEKQNERLLDRLIG